MRPTKLAKILLTTLLSAVCIVSCRQSAAFYAVEEGRIVLNGEPQYYIGTNVWYASELAVSDLQRLSAELDALHGLGLDNLRILATDENFEGLDIVLRELQQRGMSAVLFLNNAWEWSLDGYRSWLEKAGAGRQPHPAVEGYGVYMSSMWAFASNPGAVALYEKLGFRATGEVEDSHYLGETWHCQEMLLSL